jgi:hypothetical protein
MHHLFSDLIISTAPKFMLLQQNLKIIIISEGGCSGDQNRK